jgi:uncharacterized membrane protein
MSTHPPKSAVIGAIIAFGFWGTLPVFWKQLSHLGADLTLAHRVTWTMLTVLPLLAWRGELRIWFTALTKRSNLLAHAASGLLLTINWGTFIWAANHDRIVECSLGYFINPLLNVFIGSILLGETLRPLQKVSIVCAALGVVMQIVALGTLRTPQESCPFPCSGCCKTSWTNCAQHESADDDLRPPQTLHAAPFHTTRWTRVCLAKADSEDGRRALADFVMPIMSRWSLISAACSGMRMRRGR